MKEEHQMGNYEFCMQGQNFWDTCYDTLVQ